MTRNGNCLVLIIAILLLVWLFGWGGCQLIQKKTQDALEDRPTPTAPVVAPTPEKKG